MNGLILSLLGLTTLIYFGEKILSGYILLGEKVHKHMR